MTTKRPVVLIIAAVCMAVLVLFSSGLALARNFGLLGMGLGTGRFQGNFPQGGFNGQRPGFTPGNDSGQLPENFDPNNQNFQPPAAASGLLRVIRLVTTGLNVTALVLGLLAAVGIWRQKKWGAVLAIIMAALLLLTSLSGLLRFFSWLTFGEALLKVLMALAVIVLLLLPAARKAYAPPPEF